MFKMQKSRLADYWSPAETHFSYVRTALARRKKQVVLKGRNVAGSGLLAATGNGSPGSAVRPSKSRTRTTRAIRGRTHVFVSIESDADIIIARRKGRAFARKLGFTRRAQTVIAAAISEVARNIIGRSANGQITICGVRVSSRRGIEIIARDSGPGIADIEMALQYGSAKGGIGTGLAGARLLMDQFQIQSRASKGTLVTMRKWLASESLSYATG